MTPIFNTKIITESDVKAIMRADLQAMQKPKKGLGKQNVLLVKLESLVHVAT